MEWNIVGKKVQIEFSPSSFADLERLKAETEATSYAQVMRAALKVYSWCVSHQQQGRKIKASKPGENVIYELIL
ncbi:MAG: hypothetical protein CW342_06780 [Thermoactinomycetaceae bacterium]|jgi:hypothetical protein|nr:hypothetical protein [Bacillota bacterium]MBO2532589.1 hypothetical protein [Thermoactinomycetaceae bacterium]